MIHLAAYLAALALSAAPAWAEGTASPDVGALLKDGGPWGALTIAGLIIANMWWRIGSKDATISALQEKRGTENADWAGKYATLATTAAQEIRNATGELEKQERLIQALLDIAKTWPPAIDAILKGLDRNHSKMEGLPTALRDLIAGMVGRPSGGQR